MTVIPRQSKNVPVFKAKNREQAKADEESVPAPERERDSIIVLEGLSAYGALYLMHTGYSRINGTDSAYMREDMT